MTWKLYLIWVKNRKLSTLIGVLFSWDAKQIYFVYVVITKLASAFKRYQICKGCIRPHAVKILMNNLNCYEQG